MKIRIMSCLEVVPGVSVCYPELWVRRHILAELIFQSTADKDLWLKRKINTFKNIVFKRKRKRKATFSHNRMSSNNICLCIIFFIFFYSSVHNSLWTSACKYTSYLSRFWFLFHLVLIFRGSFLCVICVFDQFCSQVEN